MDYKKIMERVWADVQKLMPDAKAPPLNQGVRRHYKVAGGNDEFDQSA